MAVNIIDKLQFLSFILYIILVDVLAMAASEIRSLIIENVLMLSGIVLFVNNAFV